MSDDAHADYVRAVNELLNGISMLLSSAGEVLAIRNLPEKEFMPQCVIRVVPHWRALQPWIGIGKDRRTVPVVEQVEIVCRAQLDQILVGNMKWWTAGEAAYAMASELFDALPAHSFDDTYSEPIAKRREWLTRELPKAMELVGVLRARADVESAKAVVQFGRTPIRAGNTASSAAFSTQEMLTMTGVGNDTFNAGVKQAGVTPTGRGKKNRRFTTAEAITILEHFIRHNLDEDTKRQCRESLKKIRNKSD